MKTSENQVINAIEPSHSAVVNASAGTGKTWLLVARITRLLLNGVSPATITAITFTRKAAAEMQTRLAQKLAQLAMCSESELRQELQTIGVNANAADMDRARRLYQELLTRQAQPRITTFHAFCQQILQRFPMEAQVPPGFVLLEKTAALEREAFTKLYAQASTIDGAELAAALQRLLQQMNGMHNLELILSAFLANRADWWAYTQGQDDAAEWAAANLRRHMQVDPDADPCRVFLQHHHGNLLEFATLLMHHSATAHRQRGDALWSAMQLTATDVTPQWQALSAALIGSNGESRNWKVTKKMLADIGQAQADRFLILAEELTSAYSLTQQQLLALRNYKLMRDWYAGGAQLLAHFQTLKQEQRILDFADLEWKTCELLTQSDQAHWVQYKLDERIEHILVDEFQDTNPTQWRLIYPLLAEFTTDTERRRSVFLVGDPKQSIYGFRRAEPRLFAAAGQWLESNLAARTYSHDLSRRSAGTVVDFVNTVFGSGYFQDLIPDFRTHDTVLRDIPGHVELMPLIESDTDVKPPGGGIRLPLTEARVIDEERRHYDAACAIIQRIQHIVTQHCTIFENGGRRSARYQDILILIPTRTHIQYYEQALRDHGIPYLGANRGSLLDCQEIQDIVALLKVLTVPFDNVALATVLRSPIFGGNDEDLSKLAVSSREHSNWMDRLATLALQTTGAMSNAWRQLQLWQQVAGQVPVHDLLDRIFAEAELYQAYRAALPAHLHGRIQANFEQLLTLSLELDAGRYPSVAKFLEQLAQLSQHDKEAPDEGTVNTVSDRLQIMTIHGAKGLEAPIVFLADACAASKNKKAYECLIHWPPQQERPQAFTLVPKKEERDDYSQQLVSEQDRAGQREHAHLLYVALTRARQMLFISGVAAKNNRNTPHWYGLIEAALAQAEIIADFQQPIDNLATESPNTPSPAESTAGNAPQIQMPSFTPYRPVSEIAPSYQEDSVTAAPADADRGRIRGVFIHRLLELLARGSTLQLARQQTCKEQRLSLTDPDIEDWCREANGVFSKPELSWIFSPPAACKYYNEAPIMSRDRNGDTINGIIDRLLVTSDRAIILDYKTHLTTDSAAIATIAASYQSQMQHYMQAVTALYPERRVESYLLFTAACVLVDMKSLEILSHD